LVALYCMGVLFCTVLPPPHAHHPSRGWNRSAGDCECIQCTSIKRLRTLLRVACCESKHSRPSVSCHIIIHCSKTDQLQLWTVAECCHQQSSYFFGSGGGARRSKGRTGMMECMVRDGERMDWYGCCAQAQMQQGHNTGRLRVCLNDTKYTLYIRTPAQHPDSMGNWYVCTMYNIHESIEGNATQSRGGAHAPSPKKIRNKSH
jgi:hypothetical protein